MAITESEIKVIIAAELRKAGFTKAQKQTDILNKQFKKLAGTFLTVFSTRQVIAFGKAAVDAFVKDESAAKRLGQTLNNLNLGFEDPRIEAYISNLQRQSGVLDDQLRPALEKLLLTTGSVTKSQELLSLAIDVAAGTGKDLETVSQDLSRAYMGNTRAMSKYNLGLSKTELQTASFLTIQEKLTAQYGGQNAARLDTYAGKLSLLQVAYANMQESIGKGLVDSFSTLAGSQGIGGATTAIETFGTNVEYALGGLTYYIDTITQKLNSLGLLPIMKFFIGNQGIFQLLGSLISKGKSVSNAPQPFSVPMTISGQSDFYKKQDKARAAAEKAAAKRAKELDAMRKKQEAERLKREKLLAAQKRAQSIFDMENIQIVAALQGKIDGEQRMRLTTMLALNTENYVAAEKLSDIIIRLNAPALSNLGVLIQAGDTIDDVIKKLITSQAKLAGLQLLAEDFPIPEDIFQEWEDSLDEILKKLLEMLELLDQVGKKKTFADIHMGLTQEQWQNYRQGERASIINSSAVGGGTMATGSSFLPSITNNSAPTVVVNVAGNVISQRDLVSAITDQIYVQQKAGQQIVFDSTAI